MSSVFSPENTPERATEFFGKIYCHEVEKSESEIKAQQELAERYDVHLRTIKRSVDAVEAGKNIGGDVLLLTHCLVEKAMGYNLEPTDEGIWWPIARLRREDQEKWEANLDGQMQDRQLNLDQCEIDLGEREEALAVEKTNLRDEVRRTQEFLEERLRDIDERERQLNKRTRAVAKREAEVDRREDRAEERERQTSKWEIIRKEFSEGGLLELQPGKSIDLVQREFEEKYQTKAPAWGNPAYAKNRRITLEQQERTFNIVAAPLRWLILQALRVETAG